MIYIASVLLFIFVNIFCDINYFARTLFTLLSGRLNKKKRTLHDTTTIYGIGTFQDCDIHLQFVREARLIRELDMARYHFYDTTGVYQRSQEHSISSLQGCTLTLTTEPVPLFSFYKINTKLVYWDDRSLFLEHEVVTIRDGKTRCFLVSRQHAIGKGGQSPRTLLEGLPGYETFPDCPEYIKAWLLSMEITSKKLRP